MMRGGFGRSRSRSRGSSGRMVGGRGEVSGLAHAVC